MNISGVVARSDSSYKGLNCSSSCRFLLFLKDRNASELVVSLFRDFRFSGQIALRDGILFDEVQIMARNAVFDFERRTDWVVIGCRLKYNLILLNVKTMAVAEAEQDYNPEDQETGDPVEVSADLCEFLQGEILDDQDGSSEYLVPDFFELDFKRLLDVLCSAGQGSYSNPDETFLQWMKKYELSTEAEILGCGLRVRAQERPSDKRKRYAEAQAEPLRSAALDRFLADLRRCLVEGVVDGIPGRATMDGLVSANDYFWDSYGGRDGWERYVREFMLEDYCHDDFTPRRLYDDVWYWRRSLPHGEYVKACCAYIDTASGLIRSRSARMAARLEELAHGRAVLGLLGNCPDAGRVDTRDCRRILSRGASCGNHCQMLHRQEEKETEGIFTYAICPILSQSIWNRSILG